MSFISYVSNFIQSQLGCWHLQTKITKVSVSLAENHPQYCVLGTCKRCGVEDKFVITHPRDGDQRSVDAAAWLVENNFDFITGKPIQRPEVFI